MSPLAVVVEWAVGVVVAGEVEMGWNVVVKVGVGVRMLGDAAVVLMGAHH